MEQDLRRAAVDRAYRDHADDVYRVAYAIVHDPDGAMDVTQEAFARAFERWPPYDANRPLRPWLHGIAAHTALDALRRRRVRGLFQGGRVTEIAVHDPAAGGDPAGPFAQRQVIEEALATLKPMAHAALVVRHYDGYDYDQIATFLGTSAGNVGSVLSRAHASLRERIVARDAAEPAASPRRASR